jgi:type IV pilus assembly protein PilP
MMKRLDARAARRFAWPALALAAAVSLSGCGNPFVDDLRQFVDQSGKGATAHIPPLPPVQEFAPLAFTGAAGPDPFSPRHAIKNANAGEAPDANRKKEYLEGFALDALKMVGVIQRGGQSFALIATPDGALVMAQPGNHMGLNYGRVTGIDADGIKLVEEVQDDTGSWQVKDASVRMAGSPAPDQGDDKGGEGHHGGPRR